MTEPTDDEILEAVKHLGAAMLSPVEVARAVLAKWGTPPAVAGEPVAYLHDDGYWTAAKTDVGRRLNDRLLFAGSPKVAVYTTPQPTQPQAGAVPLTHEQVKAICVEAGYETAPLKARVDFINGIRHAERHHSIKGGQHGTDT